MSIILFFIEVIIIAYLIYAMLYIAFYLLALLIAPFHIIYMAITTTGSEKEKYINSLKGLGVLFIISMLIYYLFK